MEKLTLEKDVETVRKGWVERSSDIGVYQAASRVASHQLMAASRLLHMIVEHNEIAEKYAEHSVVGVFNSPDSKVASCYVHTAKVGKEGDGVLMESKGKVLLTDASFFRKEMPLKVLTAIVEDVRKNFNPDAPSGAEVRIVNARDAAIAERDAMVAGMAKIVGTTSMMLECKYPDTPSDFINIMGDASKAAESLEGCALLSAVSDLLGGSKKRTASVH